MKKFIAVLLSLSALLLAGCGKPVAKGEVTEEGFLNPETGIEYVECTPLKLYPCYPFDATDDEDDDPDVYLRVNRNGNVTDYYPLWFEDASNLLCYEISGYYYLVRNINYKEPTIMEFNPISADIYDSTDNHKISSFYLSEEFLPDDYKGSSYSNDSWLCQLVAEHLTNGEKVDIDTSAGEMQDLYYFHLFSQDYPAFYYRVAFFGYNGRYFLKDSSTNTTVYCPRDIILRMVGNE